MATSATRIASAVRTASLELDSAICALEAFSPSTASASCSATNTRCPASAFFLPISASAAFCRTETTMSRLFSASPIAPTFCSLATSTFALLIASAAAFLPIDSM